MSEREGERFRVVIAGAGVAALEAALALRDLVGAAVELTLLAPDNEFTLRPLAVAEPFGYEGAEAVSFPIEELAGDLGLSRLETTLEAVDASGRRVRTGAGDEVDYEALLLAIGAAPRVAVRGALTYRGAPDNPELARLLGELEAGEVRTAAFVVPGPVQWPLPIYELALLTATHLRSRGVRPQRLSLVTHESAPLSMFGGRASARIAELLREAGIELVVGAPARDADEEGVRLTTGALVPAERVVASPGLGVDPIPGVSQGPEGFIGTDLEMRVDGAPRVYAAGDATWFPIKQGGVAAQQADIAASSIASLVDRSIERRRFRPVFRGALLTGGAPWYVRAEVGDRSGSSVASPEPLWWPPAKVAGRHLSAYLARRGHSRFAELHDLDPVEAGDVAAADYDHQEALELALHAADASAGWEDYAGATRWLEVAEDISLNLPAEYAEKRRRWAASERALAAGDRSGDGFG